jgi:cell division protein FtsN
MVSKKKTSKKVSKKKTRRKVAGRTAPKKRLPGWIVLVLGALIGLIVAVIAYVNGWVPKPDNPNNKPVAQINQTQTESDIEDQSEALKIEPKKDYDFYDTLQDMEVVIDDLKQTDDRITKTYSYVLQLGSFKNLADAEALKAQVAFTGKTAKIVKVDVNQSTWHRVILGPYTSSRKADVIKRNLEGSGINALIKKQ